MNANEIAEKLQLRGSLPVAVERTLRYAIGECESYHEAPVVVAWRFVCRHLAVAAWEEFVHGSREREREIDAAWEAIIEQAPPSVRFIDTATLRYAYPFAA